VSGEPNCTVCDGAGWDWRRAADEQIQVDDPVDYYRCLCAEPPHDHKGHSEEKCVRCGWVMGHRPLNCMNDDTPHVFPSQQAEVERLTQLHERIAASDDVAQAYQQVYFEDFPTVKQAVTETLLAKEQLAAARAEIERLRADLAAERALADQLHNALCLVAVNLSGPKTAAAVAAYAAARTNGSAGATDVGAQP
jgi:hypothetical protein